MPAMTLLEAVNKTLHDEMSRDDKVVVLGEDVGKKGGVFLATAGLFDKFGAARRVGDHRYGDRDGPLRAEARARDPVPRLHLPGLRPDRVRVGQVPLQQ